MRDRLRVRLALLLVQQATARGRSVLRENKSEQDLRDVEFFSETKSKENRKTLNVLTVRTTDGNRKRNAEPYCFGFLHRVSSASGGHDREGRGVLKCWNSRWMVLQQNHTSRERPPFPPPAPPSGPSRYCFQRSVPSLRRPRRRRRGVTFFLFFLGQRVSRPGFPPRARPRAVGDVAYLPHGGESL